MEKWFTVSCRLLAPTVGVHTCTCNTGTVSALREALGVSGRQLMGSSPAATLDSHIHACASFRVWSICMVPVRGAMHSGDAAMYIIMVIVQNICIIQVQGC